LRITQPADVFLALTYYPPGDGARALPLTKFRQAVADAFRQRNGVLDVRRETALFLSRKTF
ncbi:SAM-dependent methyltransferase, partial [Rhizobium ruizarguesonis]